MKCLPINKDIDHLERGNPVQENEVSPEEIKRLKTMEDKIQIVLRMAAMDVLEKTVCMPEGGTLFDAYLALEEKCGEDWSVLEQVVDTLWIQEAIRMVMDSGKYIAVWRTLRLRIVTEALTLLKKLSGEEKHKADSKFFTLVGLHICDKVINTLNRSDEKEN